MYRKAPYKSWNQRQTQKLIIILWKRNKTRRIEIRLNRWGRRLIYSFKLSKKWAQYLSSILRCNFIKLPETKSRRDLLKTRTNIYSFHVEPTLRWIIIKNDKLWNKRCNSKNLFIWIRKKTYKPVNITIISLFQKNRKRFWI